MKPLLFLSIAFVISATAAHAADLKLTDTLPPEVVHAMQVRGLIGGKLTEDLSSGGIPTPPAGIEVDETRAGRIGAEADTSLKDWKEPLGKDWLNVRIANNEGGACDVSYWVIPSDSLGCLLYVYKIYDPSGRVLRSQYW